MTKSGILEAAPEKLFQAVAQVTPNEMRAEQEDNAFDKLSVEDKTAWLVLRNKMSRTIDGPEQSDEEARERARVRYCGHDNEIDYTLDKLRKLQ